MAAALRDSLFGEPLLLDWRESDGQDEATVRAELPCPLARLAELFGSAASVCEMLFPHLNVRACRADSDNSGATLAVSAGPMRALMPGLVHGLDLQCAAKACPAAAWTRTSALRTGRWACTASRCGREARRAGARCTPLPLRHALKHRT